MGDVIGVIRGLALSLFKAGVVSVSKDATHVGGACGGVNGRVHATTQMGCTDVCFNLLFCGRLEAFEKSSYYEVGDPFVFVAVRNKSMDCLRLLVETVQYPADYGVWSQTSSILHSIFWLIALLLRV